MGVKRSTMPARPMRQVQQEDSFWIIVAILAVISFTGSFLFVYMMTSQVDVKDVQPMQRAPISLTSAAPGVTDLSAPQPSSQVVPSGAASAVPSARASAPVAPASASAVPVQPSAASSAAVPASAAPSVAASASASPAVRKPAGTVYRVQVGAFSSRQEAQQAAQQLLASGFSTTLVAEGEDYRLQVGSFTEQDRALALAEKIMSTGQPVRIMKGTGE